MVFKKLFDNSQRGHNIFYWQGSSFFLCHLSVEQILKDIISWRIWAKCSAPDLLDGYSDRRAHFLQKLPLHPLFVLFILSWDPGPSLASPYLGGQFLLNKFRLPSEMPNFCICNTLRSPCKEAVLPSSFDRWGKWLLKSLNTLLEVNTTLKCYSILCESIECVGCLGQNSSSTIDLGTKGSYCSLCALVSHL